MKILKLLLVLAVAYVGWQYYQNNVASSHPLIGTWKSDRDKSMKFYYRQGVTAQQEAALKKILGHMELTFTKQHVITVFNGETDRETYTIVREENGCYQIETPRVQNKPCIKGNELHMPASMVKGATEVFVRVE